MSAEASAVGAAISTDEALLAAYAAGDARAFAALYGRHERPVYRYFLRQGMAPAVAEDLLQETWMAVIRHAAQFEPRARFTTWLYTVARSKLVDHWRGREAAFAVADAANDDLDDEADIGGIGQIPGADSDRPDVQALSRAQARAFLSAVEALPPLQRDAFLLQVEGGLTLEEIAAVTQAGLETVKSRLRYAMSKLRTAMEAWQ